MDKNLHFVESQRLARVKAALERNNITAYTVETAAEVVPLVQSLLPKGASCANGGSESLYDCGVMDLLRSGDYDFRDREAPGADKEAIYRQVPALDYYFASANALTENGEIYQVDGNGNRVMAMAWGPAHVVLVVGRNKIVPDIEAARVRNARISGPANVQRTGGSAPCAATGRCVNCQHPARICNMELIIRHVREKGRMTVILVNEELGY